MSDAWWAQELMRMRPALISRFRRMLFIEPDAVPELVDGVSLELMTRFRRPGLPASWFGSVPPPSEEQVAFRQLVYRIVLRRVQDRIRAFYRQRFESPPWEVSREAGPDEILEVRQVVLLLQRRLDALSPEDRELILGEDGRSTPGAPLSPADRIRRYRLRRMLAQQLKEDLGL